MPIAEIWGLIGSVLAALAIIVGGVLAWWFARGPRLVMQISGSTLVGTPADDRITLLYRSVPVPRVTQTLVWLWREGRGTIRGTDIVATDPIELHVPNGEQILEVGVLAQTGTTNDIRIKADPEAGIAASISFSYLDPRQGALIELLHTAASPEDIQVSGTIIGVPKGVVRVSTSAQVEVPVGLLGPSFAVTVPTRSIPRALREASGARTTRFVDLTVGGIVASVLRALLPR